MVEWSRAGFECPLSNGTRFQGIAVSRGRAVGPVARMAGPAQPPPPTRLTGPADAACDLISASAREVRDALRWKAGLTAGVAREVLEMTATMAVDPALLKAAHHLVREGNLAPAPALWQAASDLVSKLEGLGGTMAERTTDVRDAAARIVAQITGAPVPGIPERDEPYVLVAEDLTPADAATLDRAKVLAIVTALGGPTTHTAIIARELGIPAVVALERQLDAVVDGDLVGVDGTRGTVHVGDFDPAQFAASDFPEFTFTGPGGTADGHLVAMLANVADGEGARAAAAAGAEGIGLLRTEFCFADAVREPSLEQQEEAYGEVFAAFPGRKVVVRTLDAGADKPMRFLHQVPETNPALGVRGFRTANLDRPVLVRQLTAIARAATAHTADVWVMAPMVSTVAEAEEFVRLAHEAGLATAGVMVEVPSAALNAGPILARAAFASIGTNDLTQYTLAADRTIGQLGAIANSWDPAVLRLVEFTCRGGAQQDRPVGVCGEAAADPALAVVLVGLGVSSLSMSARALGPVSAVLSRTAFAECERLAGLALGCECAADARAVVRANLAVLDESVL